MLFGGFKEADQGPDWTVDLPEDDSWSLEILLNAVHANFSKVPEHVNISGLYKITVLTNKYDMMHCLRPWASVWTCEANNPVLYKPADGKSVEEVDIEMLWVLHELGMYPQFFEVIHGIVMNATATSNGDIQILVTEMSDGAVEASLSNLDDIDVLIDGRVHGKFNRLSPWNATMPMLRLL